MLPSYHRIDCKIAASNKVNGKNVALFIFGAAVGSSFTYLFFGSQSIDYYSVSKFLSHNLHYDNKVADASEVRNDGHRKEVHALDNNTVADELFKEVKVLCWVMTQPINHKTNAKLVLKTWGSRCNKLLLMSSSTVGEGRNNFWGKTREAFKYIHANHLNEYDWFLKADDDTYVIVENLRFMLYQYSAEMPVYFGYKFNPYVKQGYMSGGAGYVLDREAVRRFVEEAMPNKDKCRQDEDGAEDVEMGKCLENVNVIAGDSRDSLGKGRFFPFTPESHLLPDPKYPEWYWRNQYYKSDDGLNNISDNAISFHYVRPSDMYVYDYLIYHLQPYGISKNSQPLPNKDKSLVLPAETTNVT